MKTLAERFWQKVNKTGQVVRPDLGPCWEWTASVSYYGMIHADGRMQNAHRIAWSMAHGPIPHGAWVLHRCDNRLCVRPDHLFLGDAQANVDDMVAKGRHVASRGDANGSRLHPDRLSRGDSHYSRTHPERLARGDMNGVRLHPECLLRGVDNPIAKLNDDAVRKIRSMAGRGIKFRTIAAVFNVSFSTVQGIAAGKKWRHVT